MKNSYLVLVLLPIVFFLGFLGGTFWQSLMFHRIVRLPGETHRIVTDKSSPIEAGPSDEEKAISQALEDPDFKRVHDFLTRENPIQMNIDSSRERPKNDTRPFSGETPVRFSLSE